MTGCWMTQQIGRARNPGPRVRVWRWRRRSRRPDAVFRVRACDPAVRASPSARDCEYADRLCGQRRGLGFLLQNEYPHVVQPQFGGQHRTSRPTPGNDHIEHKPPIRPILSHPVAVRTRRQARPRAYASSLIPDFRRSWHRPPIVRHPGSCRKRYMLKGEGSPPIVFEGVLPKAIGYLYGSVHWGCFTR